MTLLSFQRPLCLEGSHFPWAFSAQGTSPRYGDEQQCAPWVHGLVRCITSLMIVSSVGLILVPSEHLSTLQKPLQCLHNRQALLQGDPGWDSRGLLQAKTERVLWQSSLWILAALCLGEAQKRASRECLRPGLRCVGRAAWGKLAQALPWTAV